MSALLIMIAISLILACGFLATFIWAARNGQFDDPITPAMRILHEENETTTIKKNNEDPT